MKDAEVGKWAFILGIILAILVGFVAVPYTALILMILGLIVGFMNVEGHEADKYLIAAIALLVIGIGGLEAMVTLGITLYDWLQSIMANFIAFVGASALVVAIKLVVKLGKD